MLGEGYLVTEDGRVLSAWRRGVKRPSNSFQELKYKKDKKGYLQVSIVWNGKRQTKRIHRLVAEIHIPNPDNLPCVRHRDGNSEHNHKDNLAWSDYLEDEHDKKNHGTYYKRVGGRKLSDNQIEEIRNSTLTNNELAKIYNVSRPTINRIVNNKIWREF